MEQIFAGYFIEYLMHLYQLLDKSPFSYLFLIHFCYSTERRKDKNLFLLV